MLLVLELPDQNHRAALLQSLHLRIKKTYVNSIK